MRRWASVVLILIWGGLWTTPVLAAGVRALSEKTGVELGQPLQFYGQLDGIGPEMVKGYTWDFGDGGTSSEQNPKYTFKDEGTYSVTLTITLTNGKKLSDTVTVQAARDCNC